MIVVQHPTPRPSRTGTPAEARGTGGRFVGLAVAGAVLANGLFWIALQDKAVGPMVIAVAWFMLAIWAFGRAQYLRGWAAGRVDAGRILDRTADNADLDPGAVAVYRAAAALASGGQR